MTQLANYLNLAAIILIFSGIVSSAQDTCISCHEDEAMYSSLTGESGEFHSVESMLENTPHEGFYCVDCHISDDALSFPHGDDAGDVTCLECHEVTRENHLFHGSVDPEFWEPAELLEDACQDCHGSHKIEFIDEFQSTNPDWMFGSQCMECHPSLVESFKNSIHSKPDGPSEFDYPSCMTCHPLELDDELLVLDSSQYRQSLLRICSECHEKNHESDRNGNVDIDFLNTFATSIHGKALMEGDPDAPSCSSCHSSHATHSVLDSKSAVHHLNVGRTCSACHEEEFHSFSLSIHNQPANTDTPVCTSCHGEHGILDHLDPDSPVEEHNLSRQLCGDCHGSIKLASKYGESFNRYDTFANSYHGLASRGGSTEIVNCSSCHGYHEILSISDPNSPIHPSNLSQTCGSCHPGANERFAQGKVHTTIDRDSQEPLLYWVATIYTWGIILIIGSMLLHNGLDFFHTIRLKANAHWSGQYEEHKSGEKLYIRMTVNERLQHGFLASSFIVLALTGFMLRYPDSWWVSSLRELNTNIFEWRGIAHRIAGVVMCTAGVWHSLYLIFTKRGKEQFMAMLPCRKDLQDLTRNVRFHLGFSRHKARFGHFSYAEKLEYWALIWGSLIMTVTGFLLWFENFTLGYFSKLGFDIFRTIHFYEAILATLAIIVWHFYFVIFNPEVYPMNLSWLTGTMSEQEMANEHPEELEKLKSKDQEDKSE